MVVKTRELLDTGSDTPHREPSSALLFIVALTVLVGITYLFVHYAIPVISNVILDFLSRSLNSAGNLP